MQRSEEIKVGLFVLVAMGLLVLTLVFVGNLNVFQRPMNAYVVRTQFAGGIESGAPVRYAGLKVGKVDSTAFDPKDPGRVVLRLSVDPKTPVQTDSRAQISSLGMLGEYYVEITPGTPEAERIPPGGEIPVTESVQWAELVNRFGAATDEAQGLLSEARPRVTKALDNINELTDEENRKRVRAVLKRMDDILTDAKPRLQTTLKNFDSSSAKIDKFMDDIQETRAELDKLLKNWSGLAGKEDAEVEQTLRKLRESLDRAEATMDEARRLLVANREHLDVTLENIRVSSENVRELTDGIKQRPYSLIRVKNPPDRAPGGAEKQK